jgi:hypothetical protein
MVLHGRAKSRGSYKIFEMDGKAVEDMNKNNKKKYSLSYRLNALS